MRADGKNLSLRFSTVELACVTSTIVLDNEAAPAEIVTFADVVSGNDKRWFFTITGYPDYAPASWWSLLWETPPWTPIAYTFKPYGNDAPTAEQPHFTGFAVPDTRPPIGGDASRAWTFDSRLSCTATPVRVLAPPVADEPGEAA